MRKGTVRDDTKVFGLKSPLTEKKGSWLAGSGAGFSVRHVKFEMFTGHPDGVVKQIIGT